MRFEAGVLPPGAVLDVVPPPSDVLAFQSERGGELKGREIMYRFRAPAAWCRGRILKQADEKTLKIKNRVCNFRIFFEEDDEPLNLPLYSTNYAASSKSAVDSWVLLSAGAPLPPPPPPRALEAPRQDLLALMPPEEGELGELD